MSLDILFFLSLPFLDNNSAPAVGTDGKKATPQIFTSNPLSDLVQKVYNLFARNHSQNRAQQAPLYAAANEEILPSEAQRYSADEKYLSSAASVSKTDATYDYGEAGIIGEDGEWILVRQTVPEAAQQGMHEISAKDSAYNKYVRQERAARYTGRPVKNGADIPDSKWARIWKPIKDFFTGPETDPLAETKPVPSALLASAQQGNSNHGAYTPQSYQKVKSGDWPNSIRDSLRIDSEEPSSLVDLLDPEKSLEQTAQQLKDFASKNLTPEQQKEFNRKDSHQTQYRHLHQSH